MNNGLIIMRDGTPLALDSADLTDGNLLNLFALDAHGSPITAPDVQSPPQSPTTPAIPQEVQSTPQVSTPQSPTTPAMPQEVQSPPLAATDDGLGAERENAARLARIVVSDIVLYQGEKFDEAIRSGHLLEALDSEIEEGRNFFRQRIDEAIRNERDHLMDELMRVARERGMK